MSKLPAHLPASPEDTDRKDAAEMKRRKDRGQMDIQAIDCRQLSSRSTKCLPLALTQPGEGLDFKALLKDLSHFVLSSSRRLFINLKAVS